MNKTSKCKEKYPEREVPLYAITPAYSALRLGEIKPEGWMLEQMSNDLTSGFASCLDKLSFCISSDNFLNRLNVITSGMHWWPAECRGNWLIGYLYMAFLTGNDSAIERMHEYLKILLESQDPDAYLGIYGPKKRFNFGGEEDNGEFWGMSRIFILMLAYYEFTNKKEILDAVEKAAKILLQQYGPGKCSYFINIGLTGVSHGLMITDAFEWLYNLTGNCQYKDFAVWCYNEYSSTKKNYYMYGQSKITEEIIIDNLLDEDYIFKGHGVKTVEKLRVPLFAYYATGNRQLGIALENAYNKIEKYELLTGSVVSDEQILGRLNPGLDQYYEYCTSTEYMLSQISRGQKTGISSCGDKVENVLFNAAQGARTPDGKMINYLSCDNKYYAEGYSFEVLVNAKKHFSGKRYSPIHDDRAQCCSANATKILPLYVSRMWMRLNAPYYGEGLVAFTYGPCHVKTTINGTDVLIREITNYPFDNVVSFEVSTPAETNFTIFLRIPQWSANTVVHAPGAQIAQDGSYYIVRKVWKEGDCFKITFTEKIEAVNANNGEYAVKRGPLYYALPIHETRNITRDYLLAHEFHDYDIKPKDPEIVKEKYSIDLFKEDLGFSVNHDDEADVKRPWFKAPIMLKNDSMELAPYGCTLLRKFTFTGEERKNG